MSQDDKRAGLDAVMGRLYEVISFPEGAAPDWQGLRDIFAPWARMTRITPEGVDALDLSGFESMFMEMLEAGAVSAFYEYEVSRRTEMFGAVAHVLSAYETKRSPEARSAFGRGINSVQLLWNGAQWCIAGMLWDERLPRLSRVFEPMELIYDPAA